MPTYDILQEVCLKLLTTPVESLNEEEHVHLFDLNLIANNSDVRKLITNIGKVAAGQADAISQLESCFDFITSSEPEKSLNLSKNLYPQHQKNLKLIYDLLEKKQAGELKPLKELEIRLCALLNTIVTNNFNIFSSETITLLQKALLGDENAQLEILKGSEEIFTEQKNSSINELINELKTTIVEYNATATVIIQNLLQLKDEIQKQDYDLKLIQNLFQEAYEKAVEAKTIGYPKAEELLIETQKSQYEFSEGRFDAMTQAMELKIPLSDLELFAQDAKSWALQAQLFEHTEAVKLSNRIDEIFTAYKKNQLDTMKQIANQGLQRVGSDYRRKTFEDVAAYVTIAKQLGLSDWQSLDNKMKNTKLEKQVTEISIRIKDWLKNYKEDLDSDILPNLHRLSNEYKHMSQNVNINASLLELIEGNLNIIKARDFLIEGSYEEASILIDDIKQKKIRPLALSSIESVFAWCLQESSQTKPFKKAKPPRKITDEQDEDPKPQTKKLPSKKVTEGGRESNKESIPPILNHTYLEPTKTTKAQTKKSAITKTVISDSETITLEQQRSPIPEAKPQLVNIIATEKDISPQRTSLIINSGPTKFETIASIPQPSSIASELKALTSLGNSVQNTPKRSSEEFKLKQIIMPVKTKEEKKHTGEQTPLLAPSVHSINTFESPKKNKPSNFWKYFGIGLMIVGLAAIISGVVILTIATCGTDLIVGGVILGLGFTAESFGTTLACWQRCHKDKTKYQEKPNLLTKPYQTTNNDDLSLKHYKHPARINFSQKSEKITRTKPVAELPNSGLDEQKVYSIN